MEQVDQEIHPHHGGHDDNYPTIYPPDLHSYSNSPATFMIPPSSNSHRYHHSDAFGTPHRHEQHEAEHVFNSPQLTLDPSTLNLRSNSNENPRPPSANTSGSNSTTPTGSLRLSTYNLPNSSSSGVTTRRRARAALEQLQIQIQVGVHAEAESQLQHSHQQSDMQDVLMHSGDTQMHVEDRHDQDMSTHGGGIGHEHSLSGVTAHQRNMYSLLPGASHQQGYYLNSHPDAFSQSPTSPSTPSDGSRDQNLQPPSSTNGISPPNHSSTSIARAYRPGPLTLGIPGSRSMPLVPPTSNHSSPGQQLSPSHIQHPQLSSHPHMHPSPYYPLPHNAASPGYPSTPTTSHHTQGSSSSSHSSGHTRYSLRGSPGPRGFGHRHARSSSFGTVSTMSVRSTSPANSVTSAFTSLSGGAGGSAPPSTSGPTGSPPSYGEGGDVQMPFAGPSPPEDASAPPVSHHVRSQSHPPLSMPTAQHPVLASWSALLRPPAKSLMQQGMGGYLTTSGERMEEEPRGPVVWPPHPDDYATPPPGLRMTDDEFQGQFRPKPVITRAPHRKQKLANSDRKAICMYAKQHPNARQEDIAARYNVERSTISKILKNKERWLGCPDDEAKVARKRKPRFDDLELVLKIWVEDTKDHGIVLSDALIRSKAKEEARQLGISEDKFKASSGWLENFKHRVGIRKGKYVGRELWLAASDSEGDDSTLTEKQLKEQRLLFLAEPPPGYEHAVKGFWRVPVAEIQRRQAAEAEQANQAAGSEPASQPADQGQSQASAPGQHAEAESEQPPPLSPLSPLSQGSGPRSPSRLDGRPTGVGTMRKTRSRTLAEARETETILEGGAVSSQALAPSANVLLPSPPLGPTLETASASNASPTDRHESTPPLPQSASSTSHSPSTLALADGREASAGLDAALDFIGCQPEGFATPEELAVLQKLSRRMSRAELPRHRSTSGQSGWSVTGET